MEVQTEEGRCGSHVLKVCLGQREKPKWNLALEVSVHTGTRKKSEDRWRKRGGRQVRKE